jgi:hypothetical protein
MKLGPIRRRPARVTESAVRSRGGVAQGETAARPWWGARGALRWFPAWGRRSPRPTVQLARDRVSRTVPAPVREAVDALGRLLDRHASARRVLVHLALVENSLAAAVLPAELPKALVAAALRQLKRLAANEGEPGLVALIALLANACDVPTLATSDAWSPPEAVSRFAESRVCVADTTLSTFEFVDAMYQPAQPA